MAIDADAVDAALTTTRSVRRRLDLERPVDNQIILDCIDIAEQAPSGGNQGSRRWIVVRDPAVKERIAELYMASGGKWMIESRDAIAGSGHPNERVMASAAHLAEHLAEVPAIVFPTIIGVHDGSGRPGLFDSVIQSVWSFCVAMRARGLGTAWTTAILADREALHDALSIPDDMTVIAMVPVAWTKGTDFKLAPRLPAREVTYFDGFARTWERGPGDSPSLADGPGTVVEVDILASPRKLWPHVCDLNVGADGEEFLGAQWAEGHEGPSLGAQFVGRNTHPAIGEWEVPCFIHRYDEHREFGWVTSDPDNPGAQWRFELAPIAGATRLRYSVVLGPGPSGITMAIESMPEREPAILHRRISEHRANMQRVVDLIKERAEAS